MSEAADILARVAGKKIVYEEVPKDQARASMGEDSVKMYDWFERTGYSADIRSLRRDYPDVGWRNFEDWALSQDWSFLKPAAAVHAAR